MAIIARLNRNRPKYDPRVVFESPRTILGEVLLTRGEKLATLRRWGETVCREISAATEGMATRGASDDLICELAQIEEAISCLAE
jgi:hypothetical protein